MSEAYELSEEPLEVCLRISHGFASPEFDLRRFSAVAIALP